MIYQQDFDPFSFQIDNDFMRENSKIMKSIIEVKNNIFLNNFLVNIEKYFKDNHCIMPDISLSVINEDNLSERITPAFFRICNYVYCESETQTKKSLSEITKIFSQLFYELFWQAENIQFEKILSIVTDIGFNQHFELIKKDPSKRFVFYNTLIEYFIGTEQQNVYYNFMKYWENPSLAKPENITYRLNEYSVNVFEEQGCDIQNINIICLACLSHMRLAHSQRILHLEEAFMKDAQFTSVLMPTDQVVATFFFYGDKKNPYLTQEEKIIFYGNENEAVNFLTEQLSLKESGYSLEVFPRNCSYQNYPSHHQFTDKQFLETIYGMRTAYQEKRHIQKDIKAQPQIFKRL